jgi:hypothetical protein
MSRNSITTLFPDLGPLTSPLSSSLSAIVADSLRRGVDQPHNRSIRQVRRNTTSRGQPYQITAEPSTPARKRHSIASGTLSPDESPQAQTSQQTFNSGQRTRDSLRARSMSATLGDLFTRGSSSGKGKQQE